MQHLITMRLKRLVAIVVAITFIASLYAFAPFKPITFYSKNIAIAAISGGAASLPATVATPSFSESKKALYDSLQLEQIGLSRDVFEKALHGMEKLIRKNVIQSNILSIIDFSKPSTEKRLFVIDLDQSILLFHTWVAHGHNSGKETAFSFSNKPKSKKSSLGFYVTGETYRGSNGYSLKLQGLESGFNSNAFKRAIVIHGAEYVNENYIQSQGYIGRSQGCPAVETAISQELINTIKEGTCLFIYHPSPIYLKHSSLLK